MRFNNKYRFIHTKSHRKIDFSLVNGGCVAASVKLIDIESLS